MINADDNDIREKELRFRQLKWTLQALAISPSEQLALFPDFAAKADELALDFDNWASVIRGNYESELTPDQLASLAAVKDKLTRMSRLGADYDAAIWTEEAVRHDGHWEEVRRLAQTALREFGWTADNPPVDSADRGALTP